MGVFRDAVLRDLQTRGYSPKTCEVYLYAMRELVRFHMRPPDQLTPNDIKRYQQYLIGERKVSYSSFNVAVSAFRFFYRHTLSVTWTVERVPYHKRPRRLPAILSREEVVRIFGAIRNTRQRALLMTIYACGLRLGEARRLWPDDLDEARMMLRVRCGKGARDRYVPISKVALEALRPTLDTTERGTWLFPGQDAIKPVNATTVQRVFNIAVRTADIQKKVSVHSLRHAYATHLLEDGAHIRSVQQLLGHRSLSTTTIYVHCTDNYVRELRSPLDRINLEQPAADISATGG